MKSITRIAYEYGSTYVRITERGVDVFVDTQCAEDFKKAIIEAGYEIMDVTTFGDRAEFYIKDIE